MHYVYIMKFRMNTYCSVQSVFAVSSARLLLTSDCQSSPQSSPKFEDANVNYHFAAARFSPTFCQLMTFQIALR